MSYLTRLEALEAAIAPQERSVVLIVKDGETSPAAFLPTRRHAAST
jgi:hypothetical protein